MRSPPGSFPIPVTVLTGFLGAGKTTLVNRLLKDPALADTAVIVNEFGEVPIDHLLVEASSDGVVEMGGGCLCCTVRGELAGTLSDLAARVESGAIPRLARVIIETTGLADPVPVLHSLMADPLTVESFRLDGVVTVVDAANGGATLDAHAEAVRQVAVADRIVLSKTDLAEAGDLAVLKERLALLNPSAAIVSGPDAGYAALFNCGLYDPATKTADVTRWLNEEAVHQAEHHQGEAGHEHAHRHDSRVGSFVLVDPRPLPLAALEMFLDLLLSTYGHRLLRLKGIIETVEQPDQPLVIHAVQQILHPPARLPSWPDAQRGVRLVLIGFDLPERYVRDLFAAFVNRPAVDGPDRAAMADNPLAVPGFARR